MKTKLKFNYDNTIESAWINLHHPKFCPHCLSKNFKNYGFTRKGIQRYICSDCQRTFTVLTNTIFDKTNISPAKLMQYVGSLVNETQKGISSMEDTILSLPLWRNTFFQILTLYRRCFLFSEVWLDEICLPFSEHLKRNSFSQKISTNHDNIASIGIALGDHALVLYGFEGIGLPTQKKTYDTFHSHIAIQAKLLHSTDSCEFHKKLVDKLNLSCKLYDPLLWEEEVLENGEGVSSNYLTDLAKNFTKRNYAWFLTYPQECLDFLTLLENSSYSVGRVKSTIADIAILTQADTLENIPINNVLEKP